MNQIPLLDRPMAETTIPAMLRRRAAERPDAPLLRCGDQARSGAEQLEVVGRFAALLQQAGLEQGDRVAFLAANRIELLDGILAAGWIGAVAVPLNPELSASQLAHALSNASPALIIADSAGRAGLEAQGEPGQQHALPPVLAIEDLQLPAVPVEAAEVAPGDTFAFLYTSGTTGPAKGVVCPQAQFYWWGRNVAEHMRMDRSDVLFTTLPLFHTNAINAFFQALLCGGEFVLSGKFSASRFWKAAEDCGATFTYLLGAMVGILLNRPEHEYSPGHRLRAALAPATPPAMLGEFQDRYGVELVDAFGATESNFVVAVPMGSPQPGYIGVPTPGTEIRIVDHDGLPVPDGEPGELLLRTAQPYAFATGYHKMPEATVEAWKDLWFHTGDRVARESDGRLRFLDRIKDIIRRRGENISSVEVEEAARSFPAVAEAAAYAVPSELGEDEVQLSVQPAPGQDVSLEELIRHLSGLLPGYAVPRYVVVEEELPRTANGKVSKGVLRTRGADVERWDREQVRG